MTASAPTLKIFSVKKTNTDTANFRGHPRELKRCNFVFNFRGHPRELKSCNFVFNFRGHTRDLKRCNFVFNFLFFRDLLDPVTRLSCYLQGDVCDVLLARSWIETLVHGPGQHMEVGAEELSIASQLSRFEEKAK